MKKYTFILIAGLFFLALFAQKTMNIYYKTNYSVLNLSLSSIDSMKYALSGTRLKIFTSDQSILTIPLSTIDSVNITDELSQYTLQVNTLEVSTIEKNSVFSGVVLESLGTTSVQNVGICWSTSENPTTTDNILTAIPVNDTTLFQLTNLTQTTTYYARAFVTDATGVVYGNQITFTTSNYSLPEWSYFLLHIAIVPEKQRVW
ncbi:MAG: hypothetical protein QM751_01090 [Paludibacteraceae bacterium]